MDCKRNLNSDELDELIATARTKKNTNQSVFVFATVPYTGLAMNEFLHLRDDWIYWRDADAVDGRPPEIHIPATDVCRNLRWDQVPPAYTQKPGSCNKCQSGGSTNDFEVTGRVDHQNNRPDKDLARERVVPVKNNRAEVEFRRWFKTLGRPGVPWSQNGLRSIIKTVSKKSSVEGEVRYRTLKWTFVHILAESGLSRSEMLKYIPANSFARNSNGLNTARRILEDSSTNYEFETQAIDRLRTLGRVGPATSSELAELHGTTWRTEDEAVGTLQEMELAVKVGTKTNSGQGPNPMLYDVHPDFNPLEADGIPCPREHCSRTFISINGRTSHINKMH